VKALAIHSGAADDERPRSERSISTVRLRNAVRSINASVVMELDKASDPWGVKVIRYEIKNINPPQDVPSAMEKQMRAEREKRAVILTSEGERDAKINEVEGSKQQVIKESEASKQQKINEAEGEADAFSLWPPQLRRVSDGWRKPCRRPEATEPCS